MIALTIAGFDPSAGAGILNDVKTFSALKVYGAAAITALTAQNPIRVASIHPLPPSFIEEQIDLIMEYLPIEYAKTGMLYSEDIIKTVTRKIREYKLKTVTDPVMIAESGSPLAIKGTIKALKKYLLKESILVTPNLQEAEALSNTRIKTIKDAEKAAKKIGRKCNVIITGGHLKGKNIFFDGKIKIFEEKLIKSKNTHGSGCSFSAAIVAYLTRGFSLEESIKMATRFVKEAIRHGKWGTPNQFWKL
ncbi:MAG: bifunctional hydroxymethylpyrimidine kinase/phosphomethylpyrimidine kinase [Methanobacteriaceae archaeon]|nr:bifunctional hydroxymethylpyrimidine kinase/phosphomethylpyrimidine kinase [Methanobacteriaceae archaeon]